MHACPRSECIARTHLGVAREAPVVIQAVGRQADAAARHQRTAGTEAPPLHKLINNHSLVQQKPTDRRAWRPAQRFSSALMLKKYKPTSDRQPNRNMPPIIPHISPAQLLFQPRRQRIKPRRSQIEQRNRQNLALEITLIRIR